MVNGKVVVASDKWKKDGHKEVVESHPQKKPIKCDPYPYFFHYHLSLSLSLSLYLYLYGCKLNYYHQPPPVHPPFFFFREVYLKERNFIFKAVSIFY